MSSRLTIVAIKRTVRTLLGMPMVSVELNDDQLEVCIEQALEHYGSIRPVFRYGTVTISTAVQCYTLNPCGRGIMEIFREDPLRMSVELSEFDIFRYNQFQLLRTDPADYYSMRLWRDEVKRAVGSDTDWEFDPMTSKLYISPAPTQSYKLTYLYADNPTLTEVPAADDMQVEHLALAMAKQILGRIRNKFKDIPGAESPITMDGGDLLSEGLQEDKDIMEAIANRGSRVPPMRG